MGCSDTKESRRQTRLLERKERGSNPKRVKGNIDENLLDIDQEKNEESDLQDEDDNGNDPDVMFDTSSSRNYIDVSKISSAAIRYSVSKRAAAAISTATLSAAKDPGLLKEECDTIIDQNKIRRFKTKVMKEKRIEDKRKTEK